MAGRFFLRFCLPFFSRHLPSPRYRSLFVNHALADGLHISRFFRNLETELAALAENWCEDNTPKAPLVARGAVGEAD